MESLGLIAFIIWVIVQSSKDKKRPTNSREQQQPPFPPGFPIPGEETRGPESTESRSRNPLGFEIPPIAGAPGSDGEIQGYPMEYGDSLDYEDYPVSIEESTTSWEWQPAKVSEEKHTEPEIKPADDEKTRQWLPLLKTPETARDAVIYAEIFGRPKALRRR